MRFHHHSSQRAFERALECRYFASRMGMQLVPKRRPLSVLMEWVCYRHGGHYALATCAVRELADELLRRGQRPQAVAHDLALLLRNHGQAFSDMALPIVNECALQFGGRHG